MAIEVTEDYRSLLVAVKHRIQAAQYEALKAVNRELMALYWDIGELIVTRQEIAGWGKSVVEQLAQDLQVEFHGMAGFSARNIWNMRNFYVTYRTNEKLQPMVAEIGWTHNLVIGVATYQIVSSLPLELQGQLPAPEQVARLLGGM
jgi:predicted nuclease of restriction endonuclease-like (RecB) superfamily